MMPPHKLRQTGQLLPARAHGEKVTPKEIAHFGEDAQVLQLQGESWILYVVRDGRFRKMIGIADLPFLRRLYPRAVVLQPYVEARTADAPRPYRFKPRD